MLITLLAVCRPEQIRPNHRERRDCDVEPKKDRDRGKTQNDASELYCYSHDGRKKMPIIIIIGIENNNKTNAEFAFCRLTLQMSVDSLANFSLIMKNSPASWICML